MPKIFYSVMLLLFSNSASANADFSIIWDIGGLNIEGDTLIELALDIEVGIEFLNVYGVVTFQDEFSSPAVGSCFFTPDDGVFCTVQVTNFSVVLDIDPNLNGLATILDSEGFTVDEGTIALNSVL